MATVYRALDTTLNRPVAVKLVHPHLCADAAYVERFLAMERRVARTLHPHLVTILDAAQGAGDAPDGSPGHGAPCFVVMEDVGGGTLRRRLAEGPPFPIPEAVRLTAEVAGALHHLHQQDIIHGDVKPENILLTERGEAKLIDFGIAQPAPTTAGGESIEEITVRLDALHGTAAYLAPEQIEGGAPDARSDVYALGLVAYELLAGRRPFETEHWVAAATQRLVRDPEPLTALRPDVPPDVAAAVCRALARDPADRFHTALAFAAALSAALAEPAALVTIPARRADPEATTAVLTHDRHLPRMARGPAIASDTAPQPLRTARPLARGAAHLMHASDRLRTHLLAAERRAALRAQRHLGRLDRRSRFALVAGIVFSLVVFLVALPGLLNPPRPVRVGSLAGQPIAEAQAAATAAGARVRVVELSSDSVPQGHVVRQEPPADTEFRNDRPATLYVSSGPPPVRVPDLRDRRLEDARRDLEVLGLALGKVQERETPRRPWGTVLGQSTRGLLAPGAAVDVVVGAPPHTTAPAVAGKSIGEAEVDLHKRGLVLGEVRQEPTAGTRAGTVLAQEPAAGVRLRQGEAISVAIAVPPRPGQSG